MRPQATPDYQSNQISNTVPTNVSPRHTKPTIVGIWKLLGCLHQGHWCNIFAAQPADASGSPRFDYAVKIARADTIDHPEVARQIRSEATVAAAATHPHLIPILDGDLNGSRPFIVMPRIDGQTLQASMATKTQPLPVALWWVRQAAQALAAVHQAGWIHGDVKPENLLVDSRGHITLIDLGFAASIGSASESTFRGTPEYAAPEMKTGASANPAADVFALGRTLAQLMKSVSVRIEAVDSLVESMTDPNPGARPTSKRLAEMLLRLEIETLHLHLHPKDVFPNRAA